MNDGDFLEVCMELMDEIFLKNYVFKYTAQLIEFCSEEAFNLLRLTLDESADDDLIWNAIDYSVELLEISCWVPRQSAPTDGAQCGIDCIIQDLEPYRDIEQGTLEWHSFRKEHLTASSIAKALFSEATYNALVRTKCMPPDIGKLMSINLDSTLHWGHKYEPVSIQIYEEEYQTTVAEFGCIPSKEHAFIAASPDGINVKPCCPKYGRMLEVKNIVNREITGVPKPEYWVQMQVQMAVCGLHYCDFLETRFIELDNVQEMLSATSKGEQCGCMGLFQRNSASFFYEYSPLDITTFEAYETWNVSIMDTNKDSQWIKNVYWRLDELLITEVRFDRLWYLAAYPAFEKCWQSVLAIRSGREEITPSKKRKKATSCDAGEEKKFRCLV